MHPLNTKKAHLLLVKFLTERHYGKKISLKLCKSTPKTQVVQTTKPIQAAFKSSDLSF